MFNCAALQHVIHCKGDAKTFIYSICLSEMLNSVSCVYTEYRTTNSLVFKLFALCTHACFEACTPVTPPVNGCVSDALLNVAVQNVYQAQSQNIPTMLNDVNGTEKHLNELKINLLTEIPPDLS